MAERRFVLLGVLTRQLEHATELSLEYATILTRTPVDPAIPASAEPLCRIRTAQAEYEPTSTAFGYAGDDPEFVEGRWRFHVARGDFEQSSVELSIVFDGEFAITNDIGSAALEILEILD